VNWDAIGALAEILSAFGVIASLGYLAVQIRQNTTALRGNAHEVAVEHLTSVLQSLFLNPDLAQLVGRGSRDYASLTHDERLQFGSYWASAFIGAEASLLQWKRGNLDEAVWQRDLSTIRPWLSSPGVQEWYSRSSIEFTPEFSAMVNREVEMAPTRQSAV
jgi:hypothetical protein